MFAFHHIPRRNVAPRQPRRCLALRRVRTGDSRYSLPVGDRNEMPPSVSRNRAADFPQDHCGMPRALVAPSSAVRFDLIWHEFSF
jgi:hypothetical protein